MAWPPAEGGGAWRGDRACGGPREGGSEEGALWAEAWSAAGLCRVDLKKSSQKTNFVCLLLTLKILQLQTINAL